MFTSDWLSTLPGGSWWPPGPSEGPFASGEAVSLPAFTAVDPLLSVALGVVIFDERLRHTPSALLLELVSLALLSVAAVILTRTTLPEPDQPGTAPAGLAAGRSRR